ncbi:MAG: hypothetical protein V2J55_03865 [Candidatus Competibacteraceae bacterium]|jgi:hypothetical protein|nr:hypothetical protein [Candidatus Competibacteraceae bacterium]
MAYQIWLGNPYELHYNWSKLCAEVKKLFIPVINKFDESHKNHKLNTVNCNSRFDKPAIGPNDLVIYVVPAPNFGFVGVDFGTGGRAHAAGLTMQYGGQVCSEVYVSDGQINGEGVKLRVDRMSNEPPVINVKNKRDPELLARVIFHEALHNLTGFGDHKLHNASGVEIGQASVSAAMEPSLKDKQLMANNLLNKKANQWKGGWEALNARWGEKVRPSKPQNP